MSKSTYLHFIIACIILFLIIGLIQLLVLHLPKEYGIVLSDSVLSLVNAGIGIALFILLILFLQKYYNITWSFEYFHFKPSYIKYIFIYALLFSAISWLIFYLRKDVRFNVDVFELESFLLIMPFLFLAVLTEEFKYRFVLLNPDIAKTISAKMMIIVSSFIYALAQITNLYFSSTIFLQLFIAGIFFSLIYLKLKSIWVPVFVHFLFTINFVYLTGFKDQGVQYPGILDIANGSAGIVEFVNLYTMVVFVLIVYFKDIKKYLTARFAT